MYLITLYFDDHANKILERYINKIASVTGNYFMTNNHVPPHMTISAIEARNMDVLLPAFKSLQYKLKSGTVQIVSIGQLLPYVMYGAVVMNAYLLNSSNLIFDAYKNIPEVSVSKYYQPLSWLPHITLGKTLDKEQMRIAFAALQDSFIPFNATVTKIGLAKVNPHEDILTFDLMSE